MVICEMQRNCGAVVDMQCVIFSAHARMLIRQTEVPLLLFRDSF